MLRNFPALFLAFSFVLLTTLRPCEAVDPYLVLLLEQSASYEEVTHQYQKLTAKLKSNSKLSQKKQKLYDEAYKEIVLAYVLEDKMTLMGESYGHTRVDSRRSPNKKMSTKSDSSSTTSIDAESSENKATSQQTPESSDPNPPPNSTMVNSNYETAKTVYAVVGVLLKLVPFALLIWCCLKNSQAFQANQENTMGGWRARRKKQK